MHSDMIQKRNKILIIDDEPDAVNYLKAVLCENNIEGISAENSKIAWESLEKDKPDMICLDIMMPRESGISLYVRLREDRRFAEIPVIIISGVEPAGEFDIYKFIANKKIPPPEKYIEKPIRVENFIKAINEILEKEILKHK
jgi:DNA-binding response OmpR family regulator